MDKLTYVIVEDDPASVLLLEKCLEDFPDMEYLGAFEGTTTAVLNIERKKPDLIFLDINISGLDGPEFLDLLDHEPNVIIVSNYDESVMEKYSITYEAFIQKPPTKAKLEQAINLCR